MIPAGLFLKPKSYDTLLFIVLILFMVIPSATATTDLSSDPGTGIVWGPWITGTSATGTIIHVKAALPGNITVQYGPEDQFAKTGFYSYMASGNGTSLIHQIPLTGLDPGTRYHYRIISMGGTTGDCTFLTFPVSGPVTFIVYGDSRDQLPASDQNVRHHLIADRISREQDISFVVHTGDILTDSRNLTDWDRFFSAAGIMLANTTFVPVKGNHEQDSPLWQEVFGTVPVYSFDSGPAHVTVLDSNDNVWNRLGCETAWLSDDLESTKPWKFVALHHPIYSSEAKHFCGWLNMRDAWEPTFISHNVSAVFQGHVHVYERDMSGGVMYITEGRGGSPFYALNATKIPSYQKSLENSLGYTRIRLDPARATTTVSVLQVADFAADGSSLQTLYPQGTVFEKFELTTPHPRDTHGDSREALSPWPRVSLVGRFVPFSTSLF